MTKYEKIKNTCHALGFPSKFINNFSDLSTISSESYNTSHPFINEKYDIFDNDNIKLCSLDIYENDDHVISFFTFVEEQDFLKKIHLTSYGNTTLYSNCCIYFDNDYSFLSFSINDGLDITYNQLTQTVCDIAINVYFSFDIALNIEKVKVFGYNYNNNETFFEMSHEGDNLLPIDDELLLINFIFCMYNEDVVLCVPEFYTPSAYDFNSESLQQRIKLSKMLVI